MAARRRRQQVSEIKDEAPPVEVQVAKPEDVEITIEDVEEVEETEKEAEKEGVHCRLCNRLLTAEVSVVRGLGPVCAGHISRLLSEMNLSLTAKEGEDKFANEDVLTAAIEKAKEPGDRVDAEGFDPEGYEHPAFPEKGNIKFVKLSDVHKALDEQGRSISLFIKAFGGDRGMLEPKEWYWKPVYVGRTRYLPAEVMEHLDDIPFKRIRGEKPEVEEGGQLPLPVAETAAA